MRFFSDSFSLDGTQRELWRTDGTSDGTYALANDQANVQALAAGETMTDDFTIRVSDGAGGVDTETVSITVTGTNGVDTLQIAEPLREDFLVASGSRGKSLFMPVRNVGVEDLWIDQSAQQVWTNAIHLLNTHQGWVKNVQVTKTGRFPVWPSNSKNIEIRDVVLTDAWYRLGGGTAYIGFGERDSEALRELLPHAQPHIPAIVHHFYERIDTHPGARQVIRGDVQGARLRQTLAEWMRSGLTGPHDEAFYERRARIGRVHVQIGLPQH